MTWILSPGYSASTAGKYATTVLLVSFLYCCQPTIAAMIASTTMTLPMITPARDTPGIRRLRILKIVDIS